jgi:hypothetical protein
MAKLHELTTLEIKVFSNAHVYGALQERLPAAGGKLLGAFAADIGELSRVLLLREFDSADALAESRLRMLTDANPIGCAEWLVGLRSEAYSLFPFLPPVPSGEGAALGKWYEFRTYSVRHGKLGETIEAWKDAVPARHALSPLVGAFTALDGEQPRFLNIWAYASLEDRSRIRGEAVAKGLWPPKGGPANLTKMTSTVCLPTAFSPLK